MEGKKGGINVHTMLDAFSGVASFIRMTEAKVLWVIYNKKQINENKMFTIVLNSFLGHDSCICAGRRQFKNHIRKGTKSLEQQPYTGHGLQIQ